MNKVKCILAVIWLVCMATQAAADQDLPDDTKFYVGGYFSYNLEQLDDKNVKNAFAQPVSISYDNQFGLQVRSGMEFNDLITGEIMAEYVNTFQDTADNKTAEVNVMTVGVNAKFIFAYMGNFQPYALAGLGIMYADQKIRYMDQERSDTDWGLGARIGAGCDYRILPELSVGLELAYVTGIGSPSYVRYMNISLGLSYRF